MLDDLRQRGGGADLEPTIGSLAYAPQLLDRSDVDDDRGTLRPILQPVEGVHTPGEHPGILIMLPEESERAVELRGLEELEAPHHVVDVAHDSYPSPCLRI